MRLLVLGGNGYLGTAICREGIRRGCSVTSLSRKGLPLRSVLDESWSKKVYWMSGSALELSAYSEELAKADAVIHSIGILLESRMNSWASGSGSSGAGTTYERVNRDTALEAFRAARDMPNIRTFAFISAAEAPPGMGRYLAAKREVERELLSSKSDIRCVILQPGVIVDTTTVSGRVGSNTLRLVSGLRNTLATSTGMRVEGFAPPTDREELAQAAVQALFDSSISGIVDPDTLDQLAREGAREHPTPEEMSSKQNLRKRE